MTFSEVGTDRGAFAVMMGFQIRDSEAREAAYQAVSVSLISARDNLFKRRYQEIIAKQGDTKDVRQKAKVKLCANPAGSVRMNSYTNTVLNGLCEQVNFAEKRP